MPAMKGLAFATASAASRSSASMMLKPVMAFMSQGRSRQPSSVISLPPAKPPWAICLSAMDSNHFPQACMMSGVGFSKP